MTPRAPVALSCSRRGGKLSFVTRPRVRANPVDRTPPSAEDVLSMYRRVERKYKGPGPKVVKDAIGNRKKLSDFKGEDMAAEATEAVLRGAKLYDPTRGMSWEAYAFKVAENAVNRWKRLNDPVADQKHMIAKRELATLNREFARAYPSVPTPYTASALSEFTKGSKSVEEIQQMIKEAAFGQTVSSDLGVGGDNEEEDKTRMEDTFTQSGSVDENESTVIQKLDSDAAAESVKLSLTPLHHKFIAQQQRGFSVTDIAKRMGISRTAATTLAREVKEVMAHAKGSGEA